MQESQDRYILFVSSLKKSCLVNEEFLENFIAKHEANQNTVQDVNERVLQLVKMLCGEGILTRWQCGKLMQGKYKGFQIGDFELRDQLGVSRERKTAVAFLARHLQDRMFEAVLEFEDFDHDLHSGHEPVYSIKYERRRIIKPVVLFRPKIKSDKLGKLLS